MRLLRHIAPRNDVSDFLISEKVYPHNCLKRHRLSQAPFPARTRKYCNKKYIIVSLIELEI